MTLALRSLPAKTIARTLLVALNTANDHIPAKSPHSALAGPSRTHPVIRERPDPPAQRRQADIAPCIVTFRSRRPVLAVLVVDRFVGRAIGAKGAIRPPAARLRNIRAGSAYDA